MINLSTRIFGDFSYQTFGFLEEKLLADGLFETGSAVDSFALIARVIKQKSVVIESTHNIIIRRLNFGFYLDLFPEFLDFLLFAILNGNDDRKGLNPQKQRNKNQIGTLKMFRELFRYLCANTSIVPDF